MRGKFIVLEGMEGSGKTTNREFVADLVKAHGAELVVTREPGGTDLAEQLRSLLLHYDAEPVEPLTELLLMFAARKQHLEQRILPALDRGCWVLCDRFVDATYAYQGGGRGFDVDTIKTLEGVCLQRFVPDWVIVLDVPCDVSAERVKARGQEDRFEREQRAFFERVRSTYLERAKSADRYNVIDATQALSQVQADIQRHFERRFG